MSNKPKYNLEDILLIPVQVDHIEVDSDYEDGALYHCTCLQTDLSVESGHQEVIVDVSQVVKKLSQADIDKINSSNKQQELKDIQKQIAELQAKAKQLEADVKPKAVPKAVNGK